jgi:hypothetical protein
MANDHRTPMAFLGALRHRQDFSAEFSIGLGEAKAGQWLLIAPN